MKYAYVRVSTATQEESGVGMLAQEMTTARIAESVKSDWGLYRFPPATKRRGYFVDVISAYTSSFFDRPAGKALIKILDEGDTIIMSRLDRGFRTVSDFCKFLSMAKEFGWNLVCADPPIDLSTPNGRMFATFLSMMAQWESEIKSQRIKEALAVKWNKKAKREADTAVNTASDYRKPQKIEITRSDHRVNKGRVFVYIRCSHRSSLESGLGLRYQMEKCCAYADALVGEYPQLTFNDAVITDPATSALSTSLFDRHYGGQMDRDLKEGDVVVCLRPDRVFGTLRDMSNVIQDWKQRGIKLHFAEGGFNLDTAFGEMVLSVLVAFSEMERRLAVTRAKESRLAMEEEGKFCGGYGYPPFWMGLRLGSTKKLILDRRQLVTYRMILGLIRHGMTGRDAFKRCEELVAQREHRLAIPQSGVKRQGKWAKLPKYYVPDKRGYIFPLWTESRFYKARSLYKDAMEKWQAKVTEEKNALAMYAQRDGVQRPPLRYRRKKLWSTRVEEKADDD